MRVKVLGILLAIAGWGFVPAMNAQYPGDTLRLGAAVAFGIIFTFIGVFCSRTGRFPWQKGE